MNLIVAINEFAVGFSLFQISAQESRRKKKEFVDTLERQVEVASQELGEYKRKCQVLEKEKATLLVQLKSLRAMVVSSSTASATTSPASSVEVKEEIKVEPMERQDGKYVAIAKLKKRRALTIVLYF